ncbi:hypothetical protein, partial [Streptomyces sp. NPDC006324]|uniref:hypothetical protein n=1 Tax=Streptomyces sp. NPDC006324 TaxID=3156751 RepID=UPI0033BA0FC3
MAMAAGMATVALALLGPGSPQAQAEQGVQATEDYGLSLDNFVLRPVRNQATLGRLTSELKADIPTVGVNRILQEANNTGTRERSGSCNPSASAGAPIENLYSSICFDADDAGTDGGTPEWRPQGVTSVADADADQVWGDPEPDIGWYPSEHRPMIVTWYHLDEVTQSPDENGKNTDVKGARISIIDKNTGKYAHVLLVYPYDNVNQNASYMSLRTSQHYGKGSLHAGGIVWYGYKLYVPDTARGFRVFDLRDIMDLKAAGDKGNLTEKRMVGRQDGVYYGHGYRYILPETTGWTNAACDDFDLPGGLPGCDMQDEAKKCTADDRTPRTSYASLDRSGSVRHIVSGEWCSAADVSGSRETGRVMRWPMETSGGVPRTDANGMWRADAAYRIPYVPAWDQNGTIQGAAVIDGTWYLSQSYGSTRLGTLIKASQPGTSTGTLTAAPDRRVAAIGVEDLSVWPRDGADCTGSGMRDRTSSMQAL